MFSDNITNESKQRITSEILPLENSEQLTAFRIENDGYWLGQDVYVEISWNNKTFEVPIAQFNH